VPVWHAARPTAIRPLEGETRLADGGTENLAGVWLLRFSDDGLVLEERDFLEPELTLTARRVCPAIAFRSPRGR